MTREDLKHHFKNLQAVAGSDLFLEALADYLGVFRCESGWIAHSGGARPVPGDTLVDVKFRAGTQGGARRADNWWWPHTDGPGDIMAYRISAGK